MAIIWPLLCVINYGWNLNNTFLKLTVIRPFYSALALFILLSTSVSTFAGIHDIPIVDVSLSKRLNIGNQIVFSQASYIDETPEAVLGRSVEWQFSHLNIPNLGFQDEAYWFALRINKSARPNEQEDIIQISNPLLDKIELFWISGQEIVASYKVGDQISFSQRPIPHRHFLFPVPQHDKLLLLIKVHGDSPLQLPINYWQTQHFLGEDQYVIIYHLLFFGFMLALAAYNLFLFFVIREKAYLWYVLSVSFVLITQNCINGINMQFLWPEMPKFNNWGLTLVVYLGTIFITLFTRTLLDLKPYPKLENLTRLLIVAGMTGALGVYFLPYPFVATATVIFITFAVAILMSVGSYLWYKGQLLAKIYIIAWTLPFAAHVFVALSKYAIFPHSLWVEHSVHFSSSLEGLLLSFALAYRINLERKQRSELQEKYINEQRTMNEVLEQKVAERTNELEKANQRLHKLSIIDELTQLNNRKFFNDRFSEEWQLASRRSTSISLLLCDIDNFKNYNDQYGHLCGDECLRHAGKILKEHVRRSGDFVVRYGGEEFAIVYLGTKKTEAFDFAETLRKKFEETPFEWAGNNLNITVSIGIYTTIPLPSTSVDMAIDHADKALYRAKSAGKNRSEAA